MGSPIHFASKDWQQIACGCKSVNVTQDAIDVTCIRCIEAIDCGWPNIKTRLPELSLLELVDGAYDIVELWPALTPAQKIWKRKWLDNAKRHGAQPSR